MRQTIVRLLGAAIVIEVVLFASVGDMRAQARNAVYPVMAPLNEYLMPDEQSEIALARSAAPASISDKAEVMVLRRDGYTTAVKGENGFLCIVERSWGAATTEPEFWNPKMRAPICFNPAAARTFVPIYLMKTRLVLAGKTKAEIRERTASAMDTKQLPALAPRSMCYMLSKRQYLNDSGKNWHPHVMFFVSGHGEHQFWGADLPGSPVIAADDPEERVTIVMVLVGKWSDGTTAPESSH